MQAHISRRHGLLFARWYTAAPSGNSHGGRARSGSRAPLPDRKASWRGLNAAHKLGIIHRDLKPDNIFLTRGDEGELVVKVVDFGIAKLRESATHTLTGTVLGTPAYMSFEQASGMRSDELDARSDIYSLGVVAYEMLTGRVPFHSDTPLGYIRKHLSEDPPPFQAVKPDLPALPQLERVVLKALTKDREKRYASVLEFARDLASAAQVHPAREAAAALPPTRIARPPVPPKERVELAREPVRRGGLGPPAREPGGLPYQVRATAEPPSRTKYVMVGLFLVAAIVGGIWYFSQPGTKRTSEQTAPPPTARQTGVESAPAGMVAIPGGTFTMGRVNAQDPEETPAHSVTVASFHLDRFPITNSAYSEFVRAAQHEPPPDWKSGSYPTGQDYWPVDHVSWNDAQAYCQWKGERLPSEAEWEYAACGTDGRLYPWGNNFRPALANTKGSGQGHPEPVGSHPDAASRFGLLDMSGNVWQWVADRYQPYPGRPPSFSIPDDAKVIRGGSYQSDKDHVTTTTRNLDHATSRSPIIGFRCAKSQ